jgi:hypothetical protein
MKDTLLEPEQQKLPELNGLQRGETEACSHKKCTQTFTQPRCHSIYAYLFIKTVISDNLTLTTSFFAPQNANKNKIRRERGGKIVKPMSPRRHVQPRKISGADNMRGLISSPSLRVRGASRGSRSVPPSHLISIDLARVISWRCATWPLLLSVFHRLHSASHLRPPALARVSTPPFRSVPLFPAALASCGSLVGENYLVFSVSPSESRHLFFSKLIDHGVVS